MTDDIELPDSEDLEDIPEVCFYCEADLEEGHTLMCEDCGAEFCSVRCIELHEEEGCE